jgi:hypothetical protein
MSVNSRSNRNSDSEYDYAPAPRSPARDMQALLMDLQALSGYMMREDEHDKIVDKLIMTALYLKSINRELRVKCLHLAYLFVQPNLNVTLILAEWPEMHRSIAQVYPILQKNKNNPLNLNCMNLMADIVSLMTPYTRDNPGYNRSSSASNHNSQSNFFKVNLNPYTHHVYKPPPKGQHDYSGPHSYSVFTSSIAAQENV